MDLFYREYGEGYPIIILHGLFGSSDNWTSIAARLSDNYRIILPDQRNHGRSPHDPVHTYKEMSNDLLRLSQKLSLDRFILMGHSMGGKTASWFASEWPGKLEGLVVVDISPFRSDKGYDINATMHYRILKRMIEADLSGIKARDEADMIFSDITGSARIGKFLLKNLHRNSDGRYEWKLNATNLYNNMKNILGGLEKPSAGATNMISGFPAFFLRALESDYITEKDYEPIRKLFPAAEIIEVPGSSHWIHAENPEVIINVIKDNFPV